MSSPVIQKEDGQTLVQVALVMFFLLAIISLAIDAGQIYAERRRLQNAADAGALAGAWELCFGEPTQWEITAEHYANDLNLDQAPYAHGADATQPEDWIVSVVTTETVQTFLAGLVGTDTMEVAASAEAACGGATSLCGIWPLAFHEDRWPDEETIPEPLKQVGCGQDFYVLNDGRLEADPECPIKLGNDCYGFCDQTPNGLPPMCDCSVIPGEIPPDNRRYVLAPGDRGWVLFPEVEEPYPAAGMCDNCGEQVVCWIELGGYQGPYLIDPELGACAPDKPGVFQSSQQPIEDYIAAYPDNVVNILIWDRRCTEAEAPTGPEWCPSQSDQTYHITTTGCMHVIAHTTIDIPRLPQYQPPTYCMQNVKVIYATRLCPCSSSCGGTTGNPPGPGEVRGVSLIR